MKIIVVHCIPEAPRITVNEVSADKCYGVDGEFFFGRCFVQATSYGSSSYKISSNQKFTLGNNFNFTGDLSLSEIIKTALDRGAKVYQFDTTKELFSWLVE